MLENKLQKLVVLYILNTVNQPLSNTVISELMLGEYYSPYFQLQEILTELADANLLRISEAALETKYEITKDGTVTLDFFQDEIPVKIKSTVQEYFQKNRIAIREQRDITAQYYPDKKGNYYVHLVARDKKKLLLELTVFAGDESHAIQICSEWKERYALIYKEIIRQS